MTDVEPVSNQGISRRTVTKAMAWAAPTIAVGTIVPGAAASLLKCVSNIASTGGTYPVTLSLSGCGERNSHWDFNFKIRAALQDCECEKVRITFYDNPKRSRLWISDERNIPNPSTNQQNSPQLYIQKELSLGQTGTFPEKGDVVRIVGSRQAVGTIGAHGTADDSLHTLIDPAGGALPCDASGPMATYKVECLKDGEYTTLGENGIINPCVPMIDVVSVCSTGDGRDRRYKLGIEVLNACGIDPTKFEIKNIQQNNDTNFPNEGASVWSGNQTLSSGTTYITTTRDGRGDELWVSFTTDGGKNTSIMRVSTGNSSC